MKPLLLPTILPAAAIALGATACISQPSIAARAPYAMDATDYASTDNYADTDNYANTDDYLSSSASDEANADDAEDIEYLSAGDRSHSQYPQQTDLDPVYRTRLPAYHYAYYSIARPEYLL